MAGAGEKYVHQLAGIPAHHRIGTRGVDHPFQWSACLWFTGAPSPRRRLKFLRGNIGWLADCVAANRARVFDVLVALGSRSPLGALVAISRLDTPWRSPSPPTLVIGSILSQPYAVRGSAAFRAASFSWSTGSCLPPSGHAGSLAATGFLPGGIAAAFRARTHHGRGLGLCSYEWASLE